MFQTNKLPASQALRQLDAGEIKRVPVGFTTRTIAHVSAQFGITIADLRGRDRQREIVAARHEAARQLAAGGLSKARIAKALNLHRSTVVYILRAGPGAAVELPERPLLPVVIRAHPLSAHTADLASVVLGECGFLVQTVHDPLVPQGAYKIGPAFLDLATHELVGQLFMAIEALRKKGSV